MTFIFTCRKKSLDWPRMWERISKELLLEPDLKVQLTSMHYKQTLESSEYENSWRHERPQSSTNYKEAQKLLGCEVKNEKWPEKTQDKWLGHRLSRRKGLLCHGKKFF